MSITFKEVPKRTYPEWGFRPGTMCFPMRLNFIFINGGMGDYVCWLRPIQWLAECATWIDGTLIVPNYMLDLAKYFLREYPRWNVVSYTNLKDIPSADDTPFRGPVVLQNESLNATGGHLLTCGWVYFCNKERAPDGPDARGIPWDSYPRFEQGYLDNVELPTDAVVNLTGKRYAVLAIGNTEASKSRRIPGEYWNPIIEHVVAQGLTPVFLGKAVVDTGNAKNIHTIFSDKIRYDLGVNLLDQTTLTQAAAIMSRAEVVIGHDNGLLHLAGCTDVPIVFGYNLASPQHREPHRPVGKVFNVTLNDAELACIHCQSRTNFLIGFSFRECFYGDLACIPKLFDNNGQRWKVQIGKALAERP